MKGRRFILVLAAFLPGFALPGFAGPALAGGTAEPAGYRMEEYKAPVPE